MLFESIFKLLQIAGELAIDLLRGETELTESERLALAKVAEFHAEMLERKKFG